MAQGGSSVPLRFPALRSVLYDPTRLSEPMVVTSTVCVPQLVIRNHVLASILRRGKKSCILMGKASRSSIVAPIDDSAMGGEWTLTLDAFDNGDGGRIPRPSEASLSIRSLSPIQVKVVADEESCVEDALDSWLSMITKFRAARCVTIYAKQTRVSKSQSEVLFKCIVPNAKLVLCRVPSLILLQSALTKKLRDSLEISVDRSSFGFLTLNETRKAVLLLEDDPVAYKVPVIGIWLHGGLVPSSLSLSGVPNEEDFLNRLATQAMQDPALYHACVRYAATIFCAEKVCPLDSPRTLLVCYMFQGNFPPVFLECSMASLDSENMVECYQARLSYIESDENVAEEFKLSFMLSESVGDRVSFRQHVREEFNRKEYKLDWLHPSLVPQSDRLLMQIADIYANDATATHVDPPQSRDEPTDMNENDDRLPVPFDHPTSKPLRDPPQSRSRLDAMPGRANLLVDFISKQQEEIAQLRRIVQRLEETVLSQNVQVSSTAKGHEMQSSDEDDAAVHHEVDIDDTASVDDDVESIENKYLQRMSARGSDSIPGDHDD